MLGLSRIKVVSISVVFVLIFIMGYVLIIQPKFSLLARIKAEQITLNLSLQQSHEKLNQYKKEQTTLDNSIKDHRTTFELLSGSLNLTEILAVIIGSCQENHVAMQILAPQPVVNKDQFLLQPIRIVASGDYHSLKNWLTDLLNAKQIIAINQLSMSFKKESGLLMEMEIAIYKNASRKLNSALATRGESEKIKSEAESH